MKRLGLFLAIIFFASFVKKDDEAFQSAHKQEDPESEIIWNSGRKLTWEDFQGKPDSQSSYKAMTTTSIRSSVNATMIVLWIIISFARLIKRNPGRKWKRPTC